MPVHTLPWMHMTPFTCPPTRALSTPLLKDFAALYSRSAESAISRGYEVIGIDAQQEREAHKEWGGFGNGNDGTTRLLWVHTFLDLGSLSSLSRARLSLEPLRVRQRMVDVARMMLVIRVVHYGND
jgi:hypothetical protein